MFIVSCAGTSCRPTSFAYGDRSLVGASRTGAPVCPCADGSARGTVVEFVRIGTSVRYRGQDVAWIRVGRCAAGQEGHQPCFQRRRANLDKIRL